MILMVPRDKKLFPTLGPQVCDFMERNLVFGPGDLRGKPLVLDDERRFLIWRMYEVYPRRHRQAGRRRFPRAGLSLRKGLAKTELAALISACELHQEAPVRCIGWTPDGEPIGGPVTDPYIAMISVNEEQSDLLAYGALKTILEYSALRDDFDIGLERIERKRGDGRAESLSTNPSARDGARTTFQCFDETHRFTSPRFRKTHQTMLNNLPKRKLADAWALEITTAPEPGAGSVAEATMDYAKAIDAGRVTNTSLFYFHRQASDDHDLSTDAGRRAAVLEASGPAAAKWSDIDKIVGILDDPEADATYWERVYCNRLVKGGSQAFDLTKWDTLKAETSPVKPGDLITLGFDGALFFDSTGIVATHVASGFQWKPGVWERPSSLRPDQEWQVPAEEVDAVMRGLFKEFTVWRLYADPPYWQSWIAKWRGEFGEERVIEWWTTRTRQMTAALENFITAITEGTLSHDGDADLRRHLGNARKKELPNRDEEGKPQYLIQKERPKSPNKIDLAMCATLSWEARTDAIAAGAVAERSVYLDRGVRSLADYL
jgi:hypothetical protein